MNGLTLREHIWVFLVGRLSGSHPLESGALKSRVQCNLHICSVLTLLEILYEMFEIAAYIDLNCFPFLDAAVQFDSKGTPIWFNAVPNRPIHLVSIDFDVLDIWKTTSSEFIKVSITPHMRQNS